ASRSGLRRTRSASVSPESRVAPSSTTTAHVSHSPRPAHSAGSRTPRRLAASQRYVPSATTPPRPSSPTFHSTLTLIRLLNTARNCHFGKTIEKYTKEKAKVKRRKAKEQGIGDRGRGVVIDFTIPQPLTPIPPFAFLLL